MTFHYPSVIFEARKFFNFHLHEAMDVCMKVSICKERPYIFFKYDFAGNLKEAYTLSHYKVMTLNRNLLSRKDDRLYT